MNDDQLKARLCERLLACDEIPHVIRWMCQERCRERMRRSTGRCLKMRLLTLAFNARPA